MYKRPCGDCGLQSLGNPEPHRQFWESLLWACTLSTSVSMAAGGGLDDTARGCKWLVGWAEEAFLHPCSGMCTLHNCLERRAAYEGCEPLSPWMAAQRAEGVASSPLPIGNRV